MDSFGAISWWGFSPAVDLQCDLDFNEDEVNILMVGTGDCRHIIKTIAHSYRHPARKLNFYVVESNLELYARHMLLTCLALEPQHRFGLQDKAELFLEIHGNSLVRQQTMEYVEEMSNKFIRMVTNFDYLEEKAPIFDLSNLKFKERDLLEGIFKFWRNPDQSLFDITKHWDGRLRQYLGVRYDAIPNVFDWDFHMRLVDRKAGVMNSRNYLRWRHRGIAYEIRDTSYNTSNKTLASGMIVKHMGTPIARRGYYGDIRVGPYISFGIESEEESFFKMTNNVYSKTSEDVAEYNVISMLHEILHRNKYTPQSTTGIEENEKETVKEQDAEDITEKLDEMKINATEDGKEHYKYAMENIGIYLLSLNSVPDLLKKSKFQRLFKIIYLSCSMSHLLTPNLTQLCADSANLIIETPRFVLDLSKEQLQQHNEKIIDVCKASGCQQIRQIDDVLSESHLKFNYRFSENSSSNIQTLTVQE